MHDIFKKILSLVIAVLMIVGLSYKYKEEPLDDIYILYTNDVHCAIDTNIGYAGLAAYKNEMLKEYKYVSLVDIGDFSQGGSIGALTQGEAAIELMNEVGYEVATLGNHEFDYGLDVLSHNLSEADFEITSTNIVYSGSDDTLNTINHDYIIKEYGNVKIAFIGVTTPITSTNEGLDNFSENGEVVVSFTEDPTSFYAKVQNSVNMVRKKVDYVIVLSHLGISESFEPYRSYDLINNTYGIDAVLDGHSHSVIEEEHVKNLNGEEVLLTSTGAKLIYIGELKIAKDGTLSSKLISDWSVKDETVALAVDKVNDELSGILQKKMGTNESDLLITDDDVRIIRNREAGIGDLIADAYRNETGADIALVNGGSIRVDLLKGELTYQDMLDVLPYGNTLAICEATGAEIADALEMSVHNVEKEYRDGNNPVGEYAGFLQVSGISFDVDTSIESPVILDGSNKFVSVNGKRRISNIKVLEDGEYQDLDLNKTYTVVSTGFLLRSEGDGYTMFTDNKYLLETGASDIEYFVNYVHSLNDVIPASYSTAAGRINLK